jgi:hypothetical protein
MNKTPALKVPLQTELRFHLRRYEQPHTIEGPAEQQKADDFCSERPNSSSDDLRVDAAAINLFRLPWRKVAPEAALKPLGPESRTRGSCQRHER